MPAPPPLSTVHASHDEQSLVEAIQAVARTLKGWVGSETRREGLTGPMFWTLHQIVSDGPITVGRLAEACAVTSANSSLVADDLERAGLIARTRSRSDRRVVLLEATAKGRSLHRNVWSRVSERIMEPLRGLEGREIAIAARVLQRLTKGGGAVRAPEEVPA